MKKYDSYKDSGIEWIGEIPEHWDLKKIKHTTYVKGRIGWQGLRSEEFKEEAESLVVTGTDFIDGKINWDSCYQIPIERYNEDINIQLRENDLLITKDGTIGKVSLVKNMPKIATLNSGVFLTRPSTNAYKTEYMYWVLVSDVFKTFYDYNKSGSTIQHLYQYVFNEFNFTLPPTEEQTSIANYLDHKTSQINHLIAKKEQFIKLLEEERVAVINQAVTKGLNPNVPMKDSGVEWLGEIPEHWVVKRIKHLLSEPLKYGANESAEEENLDDPRYIRITDFGNDGKLKANTFKSLPYSKAENFLLVEGDILFARSGATVGKTFFFNNYKGIACFAGYLIKASCDRQLLIPEFLYEFTNTGSYNNWKQSIFQQSTIQNIGADKYNQLKIAIPPISEQNAIVEFLKNKSSEIVLIITKAQQEIELLKEYKTALISEVVTGKVDVRNEILN